MNRTVVHLIAAQPVSRTELADLGLDLVLQCFKPTELFLPSGQPLKVGDHQCAHRGVALCCCDPGIAVDLIRNRDRNILHSFTVSQFPGQMQDAATRNGRSLEKKSHHRNIGPHITGSAFNWAGWYRSHWPHAPRRPLQASAAVVIGRRRTRAT